MWCLETIIAMNEKAAEKAREEREKEQARIDKLSQKKVSMPQKEAV